MGISKYYGFWEAILRDGVWFFAGPFFSTLGHSVKPGEYFHELNQFLAPDHHREFIEFLGSFSQKPKNAVLESECFWLTAKGEMIPTYISGQVTEWQGNQALRLNFYTREATVWNDLPEHVQLAHEQFQNAFKYSAIGLALVSPKGQWLRVNKRVCEIVGYSEEELLKITFQDITHPDDLNIDLDGVHKLLTGEIDSYQIEKRYINKQGQVIWVLLSVSLVRDRRNEPLHFISQIQDISKRKRSEIELKDRDALLSKLSQQVPGSIYQYKLEADGSSRFPFASEGIWDVYELSPRDVEEDASAMFKRFHPDDYSGIIASLKESEKNLTQWNHDYRVVLPKKGIRWLNGSAHPERTIDGGTMWHGYINDITDYKAKEGELRHSLDIISEQNKRLLNFAHIVSHNLRSHSGNIEMILTLLDNTKDPDERENLVGSLHQISGNLSEAIVHLNEVVSIQTEINQQREKLNLYNYVEKTLNILAGEIQSVNAQVQNKVSPRAHILYNPAYLESVLLNFVSNAIKYRHPERTPEVTIAYNPEEQLLTIEDNGLGIDLKKHQAKLFGMYKTFHRNKDSRGIGLFITKSQVESMGGKIEVQSEVNQGTSFHITLG